MLPPKKRARESEDESSKKKCSDCSEYFSAPGQMGRCSACHGDATGKHLAKRPASHRLDPALQRKFDELEGVHSDCMRKIVENLSSEKMMAANASWWRDRLHDSNHMFLEKYVRPLATKLKTGSHPEAHLKSLLLASRVLDYWRLDEVAYDSDVVCRFNPGHQPSNCEEHVRTVEAHQTYADGEAGEKLGELKSFRERVLDALAALESARSQAAVPPPCRTIRRRVYAPK